MTELLSPPKIAKELKVSPDTVRGWIKSGALAAVNLGVAKKKPRRRVSRDSLNAFLATRAVEGKRPQPQRYKPRPGVIQFYK
jgi:excisionase family DNA binding protein